MARSKPCSSTATASASPAAPSSRSFAGTLCAPASTSACTRTFSATPSLRTSWTAALSSVSYRSFSATPAPPRPRSTHTSRKSRPGAFITRRSIIKCDSTQGRRTGKRKWSHRLRRDAPKARLQPHRATRNTMQETPKPQTEIAEPGELIAEEVERLVQTETRPETVDESELKVLLVNGPNLNLLGQRQPEIYGATTLRDIEEKVTKRARELEVDDVRCFQSNHEGAIVD